MKTLVVAEIGQNWESLKDIQESVEYVTAMGAVPKLQAWITEDTVSKERSPELFDKMKAKELPREWYYKLKSDKLFYSIFCESILDFLEAEIHPWAYKIASPDCVNEALIKRVVATNKPLFISVGGARRQEIRNCIKSTIGERAYGWNTNVTFLDCMVEYPAKQANLGNLNDCIHMNFITNNWGYSDHTANPLVPALAVAIGAKVIECHFKLRSDMQTPDAPHSLDKSGFGEMVKNVIIAEENTDMVVRPTEAEKINLNIGRRGNDGKRPVG